MFLLGTSAKRGYPIPARSLLVSGADPPRRSPSRCQSAAYRRLLTRHSSPKKPSMRGIHQLRSKRHETCLILLHARPRSRRLYIQPPWINEQAGDQYGLQWKPILISLRSYFLCAANHVRHPYLTPTTFAHQNFNHPADITRKISTTSTNRHNTTAILSSS